ncbi:MAG TPA: arginine deiminase-related protein [Flavobacterium sp.]|nr:arginine deiminase-related protein [Flavobacterium sp.]
MNQTTNTILMIRPVQFRMNEQTAVNNYYQQKIEGLTPENANQKAQQEFDGFVERLRSVGVNVIVVDDTKDSDTPDSIFPNNWISFHENAEVVLYPMFAENRRLERREDILDIVEENGFVIDEINDYTSAEQDNIFLEGTGSMILDRENGKVYAALSPRADEELIIEFCEDKDMQPVIFEAYQTVEGERLAIYHTNVMMSVAETFAILCADSIDDKQERKLVINNLKEDGKEVILITEEQVNRFAGNMLQVAGKDGQLYMVMSTQAYESLTDAQIKSIEKHCAILHAPLYTIEACGGGSARCMLAEVFLPKAE